MAQYIDKDALVAEIEKRIESCVKQIEVMLNEQWHTLAYDASARMGELNCIQDFLDTLEVKEVDLDGKIDDAKDLAMRDIAWKIHCMISEGKGVSEIDHYVCGICDF